MSALEISAEVHTRTRSVGHGVIIQRLHKLCAPAWVPSAAAGKAVDVLLEEYADSSAAGEGASHPPLTHDGQACETRTCAHAGSTEQAPQPMKEDNAEPVRSTTTLPTSAIPGHSTSITCARLLLRSVGEP